MRDVRWAAAAVALLATPHSAWADEMQLPLALPHCDVGAAPAGYIKHPQWTIRPDADDAYWFYPPRLHHSAGCAILDCRIAPELSLDDCQVLIALPPEENYGAAALKMSRFFKIAPADADGAPVSGRRVRIPIRWVTAPDIAPPTPGP